jgi:alcohol dehydrogenase
MTSFALTLPTTIHFGPGVTAQAGKEINALLEQEAGQHNHPAGSRDRGRVLVVTDEGIERAGLLDGLLDTLARSSVEPQVFWGVEPNPRNSTVQEIARVFKEGAHRAVVAIGGGSVLDAAKGALVVAAHGGNIGDYEGWEVLPAGALPPLVAIPTTAGTGSEVGAWAVITDTTSHRKLNIGDRGMAPAVALVDPTLTYSLPKSLTVATGMDALAHAIEAYTTVRAQPISDALALEAIRLIVEHLPVAAEQGEDEAARSGMMLAATMAGMAMDQTDVGPVHCLSEAMGGMYDAPHGQLNAVLLPYVMVYNVGHAPGRYANLAQALGGEPEPPAAVSQIVQFGRRFELPSLADLGAQRADFGLLSQRAAAHASNASNPKPLTPGEYQAILEQALAGDLPAWA